MAVFAARCFGCGRVVLVLLLLSLLPLPLEASTEILQPAEGGSESPSAAFRRRQLLFEPCDVGADCLTPGEYCHEQGGQRACFPSSAGEVPKPDGVGVELCGPGTFATAEMSECAPCTQGSYSPLDKNTKCFCSDPGSVPNADHSNEVACTPGTYAEQADTIIDCPDDHDGDPDIAYPEHCCPNEACAKCEPGRFTSVFGSTSCDACTAGFECPAGSSTPRGSACPAGVWCAPFGVFDGALVGAFDASVGAGAPGLFAGASAVGTKVIFAPAHADFVGVYDVATGILDTSVSTGVLTLDSKFEGAATVGTKVVFAPLQADVVGVYDVATGTFDASVSTGALTSDSKFKGAAAVGTKVVFAPYNANVVGVYDVATGTFDASVSTGALTIDNKFTGAAAVGTKVVFAPLVADVVGVYDVATGTFDASVRTGALTIDYKFIGAAAVGTKVVFAPLNVNVVGVYDVATGTFDATARTHRQDDKFRGAAAVGTKVVFAPSFAGYVGVFDVATSTFQVSVGTGSLPNAFKFNDAVAVGTTVVFVPIRVGFVGTFELPYDGVCDPGSFCPAGSSSPQGTGLCAEGRFCPAGSSTSQGAGPCEAGFECPAGSSTPRGSACPAGVWCAPFGVFDGALVEGAFDARVGTGALTIDFKFFGAAAVGTKVVFAPLNADVVGVYDVATGIFDASVSTGELAIDNKFVGAAAVDSKVVFAPYNANVVGVYDVATGAFDASVSTGTLTRDSKFVGAAAVGSKVVFAPQNADVVGVYDVATGTFDASVSTGALTIDSKFYGAAAVGSKVVFVPRDADVVGVYDVATGTFDASVSTGALTMNDKFSGAATVGSKVVFAPHNADVVGVYDVETGTFEASVSTGTLTRDYKFIGAAAIGTKVVFVPYDADVVGVYDVATGTFDASVSTGTLTSDSKFIGAAAIGSKVVFAPYTADVVGTFELPYDGVCDPGHFCPAGSSSPQGAGLCAEGRFCPAGSSTSQGTGPCEAGFECPAGSSTPRGIGLRTSEPTATPTAPTATPTLLPSSVPTIAPTTDRPNTAAPTDGTPSPAIPAPVSTFGFEATVRGFSGDEARQPETRAAIKGALAAAFEVEPDAITSLTFGDARRVRRLAPPVLRALAAEDSVTIRFEVAAATVGSKASEHAGANNAAELAVALETELQRAAIPAFAGRTMRVQRAAAVGVGDPLGAAPTTTQPDGGGGGSGGAAAAVAAGAVVGLLAIGGLLYYRRRRGGALTCTKTGLRRAPDSSGRAVVLDVPSANDRLLVLESSSGKGVKAGDFVVYVESSPAANKGLWSVARFAEGAILSDVLWLEPRALARMPLRPDPNDGEYATKLREYLEGSGELLNAKDELANAAKALLLRTLITDVSEPIGKMFVGAGLAVGLMGTVVKKAAEAMANNASCLRLGNRIQLFRPTLLLVSKAAEARLFAREGGEANAVGELEGASLISVVAALQQLSAVFAQAVELVGSWRAVGRKGRGDRERQEARLAVLRERLVKWTRSGSFNVRFEALTQMLDEALRTLVQLLTMQNFVISDELRTKVGAIQAAASNWVAEDADDRASDSKGLERYINKEVTELRAAMPERTREILAEHDEKLREMMEAHNMAVSNAIAKLGDRVDAGFARLGKRVSSEIEEKNNVLLLQIERLLANASTSNTGSCSSGSASGSGASATTRRGKSTLDVKRIKKSELKFAKGASFLAKGAYGEVSQAKYKGKACAVKQLRAGRNVNHGDVQRFVDEIVTIHELGAHPPVQTRTSAYFWRS